MTPGTDHDRVLALVELGRLTEAEQLAKTILTSTDNPKIHLTLAWIALDRGDPRTCARHLDATTFTDPDRSRAECLRGLLLCQQAAPELAITSLTRTIRVLRRRGDDRWLANALTGRGIARSYASRLPAAHADFTAAHTILTAIGEPDRAAMCLHNKGFAAMLGGDPPTALHHYEQAARHGLRTTRRPEALIDRAQALLAVGLTSEARTVLHSAVRLLEQCDRGSRLPEALLLAARCALRDNDSTSARTLAEHAESLFRSQHRTTWVPAAQAVALRAGAPGSPTTIALACDRHGHHDDAAEVRLPTRPHDIPRHHGTPRSRAIGWLGRARTATARRDAVAACRAGLRLHAPGTWPGTDLTATALDHALTCGDARSVLHWTERRRAPLPTPTTETADALAELRAARGKGEHHRIVTLEREIRRLSLTTRTVHTPAPSVLDLTNSLADKAMLVFVSHRDRLAAVSVLAGRVALHDLGDAGLTARHAKSLELKTNPQALAHLDRLLAPADDRPLVIVPSEELERVPWAALPSCRGRAVSVVPSVNSYLEASRMPLTLKRRTWVAGPQLRHAEQEIQALQRKHGGTRASTADETLLAMECADVVHIAAHGVRRLDLPLFSHLVLGDGPLHGHDFDRLAGAPSVVVLSACDSGLAPVLLRRGVRAVIACVRAVPDDGVAGHMLDLHAALHTPAQTLAEVQERHGDLGFLCYGAG